MIVSLIAAVDRNGTIGFENGIPWDLPADRRYFKQTTMGKPIIMGRKTYESIGRVLPGRKNIVISRNPCFVVPGGVAVASPEAALAAAGDADEVMVIGGATIYEAFMEQADRLYLTYVEGSFPGDTTFPTYEGREWRIISQSAHDADERNPHRYRFVVLERRARNTGSG